MGIMKLTIFVILLVFGLCELGSSKRPKRRPTIDQLLKTAGGGRAKFGIPYPHGQIVEIDIMQPLISRTKRKAISDTRYRWPNGVVPYVIENSFSASQKAAILKAMKHWKKKTKSCVRFRPAVAGDANRVIITKQYTGCWSYVGMLYYQATQYLNLGNGCLSQRIIIHELGHAIGLWHEQSRPDRNTRVKIHYENIQAGKASNFDIRTRTNTYNIKYDYRSIMHYGQSAFSKNGKPTITTLKKKFQTIIGTGTKASGKDKNIVKRMYGC